MVLDDLVTITVTINRVPEWERMESPDSRRFLPLCEFQSHQPHDTDSGALYVLDCLSLSLRG